MDEPSRGDFISDDEIIYRRVPTSPGYYDPEAVPPLSSIVFRPLEKENTGISVWRASLIQAEELVRLTSPPGKRFYVAAIIVGRLRARGVTVVPSPMEGQGINGVWVPGHATITTLNYRDYITSKNQMRSLMESIVRVLIKEVLGPFGPFD